MSLSSTGSVWRISSTSKLYDVHIDTSETRLLPGITIPLELHREEVFLCNTETTVMSEADACLRLRNQALEMIRVEIYDYVRRVRVHQSVLEEVSTWRPCQVLV